MNTNTYVVTKDPVWHRWVDGLVILSIGFVIGVILSQVMVTYETEVTNVKVIRRLPAQELPNGQSGEVDAPLNPVKVNEI